MSKVQPTLDLGVPARRHPLAGEKRRKPNGTPSWSEAEDEALAEMWRAGYSDEEVAAQLGRSPGAVEQRRSSLGLIAARRFRSGNEWTPQQNAGLRSLFAAGRTDAQIGRALGKTAAAVRSRRQSLQLWRQPRG